MKSKSRCSAVLEGLKGVVEGKNKLGCHAERAARRVSASSTHDVAQAKQQRPTWKIPNQVWNDVNMDDNINICIGQVKPDINKGVSHFTEPFGCFF